MNADLPHLWTGRGNSGPVLILAHGAGAPMDSAFMDTMAEDLAERDLRVLRFEFPYMAKRRADGKKRPPDRMPALQAAFEDAIALAGKAGDVVIGGKSMGGRVASMIASLIAGEVGVRGVACLGYPFHPPGRPDKLRTEHLESMATPTLIVQGTRDPFGKPDEVKGYRLSSKVTVRWIEDGNHDLAPRKSSGRTAEQNWREAAEAIADFARGLF